MYIQELQKKQQAATAGTPVQTEAKKPAAKKAAARKK
jgi:hypothetical protein